MHSHGSGSGGFRVSGSHMPAGAAITVLHYGAAAALAAYVLNQARKPTKWGGRLFLRAMNEGHSSLTDWGLSHVVIKNHFTILDVGCGGGRTVEELAAIATEGVVYGVDYSDGSVAASLEQNQQRVKASQVVIEKAAVSQLPFPGNKFDLVTAVETQYYWPNLLGDMQEILRVLKPGGRLVVIAETYNGGKYDRMKWLVMWVLRSSHVSVNDHRELFLTAGYTDAEIFEENNKGWICATARKPTRPEVSAETI